jgi:hypothetical protein
MIAVDSWKSSRSQTQDAFLKCGARWIFSRRFGKIRVWTISKFFARKFTQSIRIFPTRCSHDVHMRFGLKIFVVGTRIKFVPQFFYKADQKYFLTREFLMESSGEIKKARKNVAGQGDNLCCASY